MLRLKPTQLFTVAMLASAFLLSAPSSAQVSGPPPQYWVSSQFVSNWTISSFNQSLAQKHHLQKLAQLNEAIRWTSANYTAED